MEYEAEGARPRDRPKRTWREIVEKDCQARKLNRENVPWVVLDKGHKMVVVVVVVVVLLLFTLISNFHRM